MRELRIVIETNEFDDVSIEQRQDELNCIKDWIELELLKNKLEGTVRVELSKPITTCAIVEGK